MTIPVIVIGGGGHAKVLLDALSQTSASVLGFVALNHLENKRLLTFSCIGGDEAVLTFAPLDVHLVNGIGSVREPSARRRVYEKYKEQGYAFVHVLHPAAVVSPYATLGEGVQVMAGATVQTDSVIAENCLINTRASVDHDCLIGSHVHIAPGATICGGVKIGSETHIGSGATVIQGVTIGHGCMVGAGALVIRDVPDGATVIGVPAKEVVK